MASSRCGRQTVVFHRQPCILSSSAIGGRKEQEGPLAAFFDHTQHDTTFSQPSWEKAERRLQELALEKALQKAGLQTGDLNVVLAGDLLNQCITSSFAVRNAGVPFLGLYGACSTMAQAMSLAGMLVDGGYADTAAAMSSSHYASAERQYRFPLGYGGQRTPTAQWTVTGAGCMILGTEGNGPYLQSATVGSVIDYAVTDANNMGAAMAPAAFDTIRCHLDDLNKTPQDYDMIVTGDLGMVGKEILQELFLRDGVSIGGVYHDCGTMVFDLLRQDVHAGGSGCGCGTVVLCGYILRQMAKKKLRNVLFCGTGALLSAVSSQQGESIPGICHAVSITTERR